MNNFDDILNNAPVSGAQSTGDQTPQLSKEDYAAKKQAERNAIFGLSDDAALHVSSSGEQFQSFLDVQGRFDRYSAVNALLIYAQQENLPNEKATRLGDFDYWKDKGGYIKQGQTAIAILEPHEYVKEDGSPGISYNIKKVFDVSQVDTRNMKKFTPPTYNERQILTALISNAPVKVTGVDELSSGGGAMTDPQTGEIFVLKGMGFYDTFRSVTHELAYAEIDYNRENPPTDPQFTAYCASYLLCKKYGIDTKDYNFDTAPVIFRDKEPQAIKGELSHIRDAAAGIGERMAKQLDAAQKAARNTEAR